MAEITTGTPQVLKKYQLSPEAPDYEKVFRQSATSNTLMQIDVFGAALIDNYSEKAEEIAEKETSQLTPAQKYHLLTQTIHFGDSVWLETMPYGEFLGTLYWQIIKEFLRSIYAQCQLCGSCQRLHTHHPTYKNRGWEWSAPLQNLTILCSGCHARFHARRVD